MKAILILVLFFTSCANPTRQELAPPKQNLPAKDELRVIIPEEPYRSAYLQSIDKFAQKHGLPKLRETILLNGDIEIRMQVGFGLYGTDALVLKRTSGEWQATHFREMLCHFDNKGKANLAPPKSGWEATWESLKAAGILSQSGVKDSGWNDGTSYIVETNLNKTYTFYVFGNPQHLNNREGKQMIEISEILTEEFGLTTFRTDPSCR